MTAVLEDPLKALLPVEPKLPTLHEILDEIVPLDNPAEVLIPLHDLYDDKYLRMMDNTRWSYAMCNVTGDIRLMEGKRMYQRDKRPKPKPKPAPRRVNPFAEEEPSEEILMPE